jgi:tetratricopeptide (TPR) repeat protein
VETGNAPAHEVDEAAPAHARRPTRGGGGSVAAALNAKDYPRCVERAASRGDSLSIDERTALGWCLLNLGRQQEAARAFDGVMRTASGKQKEDAAYGKSLALVAAGEALPAINSASQTNLGADERNALGAEILERRAWDALDGKRYAEALQWLDRRAKFTPESRDLMRLRIMCLQHLGQSDAAQRIQNALDAQLVE